jgi:hypothetical protein
MLIRQVDNDELRAEPSRSLCAIAPADVDGVRRPAQRDAAS